MLETMTLSPKLPEPSRFLTKSSGPGGLDGYLAPSRGGHHKLLSEAKEAALCLYLN
jgi:hypothetical protein